MRERGNKMKKGNEKTSSLRIFGFFILEFIFLITSMTLFSSGKMLYGLFAFIATLSINIFIFIKGKKVAAIFGALFLIFVLVVSVMAAIYGFSLTKEVSEDEKQQILEEKKESIDNLFEGYESRDYNKFSRDLNELMKEKHDKIEFLQLREGFGNLISKDCSDASKSTIGGSVVLCEIEFENVKTGWDIRFTGGNEIWGLYFQVIVPELNLEIKNKSITKSLQIVSEGQELNFELNNEENSEDIFLIFEVSLKNEKDEKIEIHSFNFDTGVYAFGQMIPKEYSLKCNNILPGAFAPNEEKEGCLVFIVTEGYEEGEIKIE